MLARKIAAAVFALLVASSATRAALAETVSVELDALVGFYGPGRTVPFDVGAEFLEVRFARLTVTGSGTPALWRMCGYMGTGTCSEFRAGGPLYWVKRENGPGIYAFLGSFSLGSETATVENLLIGEEARRAVFLDGKGEILLTHDGISSIPEYPILQLEPDEFQIDRFALAVEGIRFRGANFNDTTIPPGTPLTGASALTSKELRVESPRGDLKLGLNGPWAANGTLYLVQVPPDGGPQTICARRLDGQPLSLHSFAAAEWDGQANTEVLVRGRLASGEWLERRVVLDGVFDGTGPAADFERIGLDPAWSGLSELEFVGGDPDQGVGLFALDDVMAPPTQDLDQDGVDDAFDSCAEHSDPQQTDTDGNGIGDACNDYEDPDQDEFGGAFDNCAFTANPDQANRDGDAWGDVCDLCRDYAVQTNTDRDRNGIGDPCECGDQTGDGLVDVRDLVAIHRAIFGQIPASPLCDTNDDGRCDVTDIVGANHRIFGAPAWCSRHPLPAK